MVRRLFAASAVVIVTLIPAAATAQDSDAASVNGTVRDSSGGAIPGATVRVVSEVTGRAIDAVSDERGGYQASDLAPGKYRIETTLDGFEPVVRQLALETGQQVSVEITLTPRFTEGVVVTARRVEETAQEVPIPLSIVDRNLAENAGAFNVNRLKELVPTVQFYSTNPRNSAINIRGLGAPFGLANDGLEPGVGLYIDGVFYARPASATLDFLDVERIEVLRGPQGTLFGKNTTAGAINVTTRRPSFTRDGEFELNVGNLGFVQAKASVTSPFGRRVAGRISFSGTQRDGTVYNVRTRAAVNGLNNAGIRGQLLFAPTDKLAMIWATDYTRQRPEGYTQVVAGVAPTLRAPNRQFGQIAAELDYTPPSHNAFDRLTDIDSPLRSDQDLGGSAFNVDWKLAHGVLTSTTGWRFWNWNPSNDRDFIGLPITTLSAAPSKQRQWSQEIRYAGIVSPRVNFVAGGFLFHQGIVSNPSFRQEQGAAAARVLLAPSPDAATPGLLDGYGFKQSVDYDNTSAAVFGQLELSVTDRLRLLPGLRFNYDQKKVDFDQQVYGGLQTTDPALIALQLSVLAPQAYQADVDDTNVSGQLTAAYAVSKRVNTYATYATGFKSVGLNLNGLPTDDSNQPVISAATVQPEHVRNLEVGVKVELARRVTANLTTYDTAIANFQAHVTNASVGVLRGYLANAERVRVRGAEFDSTARLHPNLSLWAALAYTDGHYTSFRDAPPPLEETGGPLSKDISGSLLPGISKWAVSAGGEYTRTLSLFGHAGHIFSAVDVSYRSSFSSSATVSRYLMVEGYHLLNARVGFRAADGWTVFLWSRNLLDREYFELLTAAPANTGLIVGQPGDARTAGITLRVALKSR